VSANHLADQVVERVVRLGDPVAKAATLL